MTKKIFVAESSKILAKMICSELEKQGWTTETFKDGYSVLKKIVTESPDLIIADKDLPLISGTELCRIMKSGSTKDSIPFILLSVDDTVYDFWNSAIEANRVVLIKNDNIDYLIDNVKELLDFNFIEANDFYSKDEKEESSEEEETSLAALSKKSDEEVLASWIVNAMSKSEFFYNMSKSVIELYSNVSDINFLVEQIFRMLYGVCAYDVAALVLDSQPTKVFVTGAEFFEVKEAEEFWNICKVDYEQQAKKNHTITYEENRYENIILERPEHVKLESYRAYTISTRKDFIGTLHLASTKKKTFTYKVQSSIEFVTPALASILQESVQRAEIAENEVKLRNAFSKFVPEQVINDFINTGEDDKELTNNNEKRNVVILMCDIRNFTSISEINKPEDVVNFLNTYFTFMVNIVKKYGGTVDKFIGDAIMVLFGAPISYNDNAKRAVQAAIEMYAQLDSIPYGQLKFPEGIKFDIGIGIHYGDVIVGQIGSADKTNYTVIGDAVNLASRLEGLTKLYGAKVIISQAVRDELGDSMNLLLLDSVKVKGKKEAVFIYRVDEKPLPKDFVQVYDKGFKSYNEGAFSLAIPYFEQAINILPEDKAARLMLERCEEFSVNKPDNWDGAIALTSK